ncbi:glycine tRNA synthetase, partial [gut metagenome]
SVAFADGVESYLRTHGFLTAGSLKTVFGAPRRLAVHLDEAFTQKLVPVRVGIAADGSATPALEKKMKNLGIDCAIEDLKRVHDG